MELRFSEKASVFYHNIFDYPLSQEELKKWKAGFVLKKKVDVKHYDNFYFIKGRRYLIKKRKLREYFSKRKLKIAERASSLLSKIPAIKFIGLTGALAMNNATKLSDIDFLIISKKGSLWTTRFMSYVLLTLFGFKTRKPNIKNQNDALCLNMWLDESDIIWGKNRNAYTAHEIAQIIPLFNKEDMYEKFIQSNVWALKYWPNALIKRKISVFKKSFKTIRPLILIEDVLFNIQYFYMKGKMTREIVTRTKAFFHPYDWSRGVMQKLTP